MENTIPQELIDSALALTGKTEDYLYEWAYDEIVKDVDYNKLYAYILSPVFIEKYIKLLDSKNDYTYIDYGYAPSQVSSDFWTAIYEHQSWDSSALISLLQKI